MNTVIAIEYLRDHTPRELSMNHGVEFKLNASGTKASLDYNQLTARDNDPVACQCRGMVVTTPSRRVMSLDECHPDLVVLARPMDRFFNYGTPCASVIDINDPETVFEEKVDGTCEILYHDPVNGWSVGTRSVCDADQSITVLGERCQWTFRGLFERAVGASTEAFAAKYGLKPSRTYVFELCTPMNPVVVLYEGFNITLLAVRDRETGLEFDPRDPDVNRGLPTVPQYRFGSLEEMIAFVGSRSPKDAEGLIMKSRLHGDSVNGGRFDRVKVKNPAYMAANQIGQKVLQSPRAVMTLILGGHYDDIAPQLNPFVREKADAIKDGLRKVYTLKDGEATRILSENHDRKSVALAVQGSETADMGYVMARFLGKCVSYYEYIQSKSSGGAYPDAILDKLIAESTEHV